MFTNIITEYKFIKFCTKSTVCAVVEIMFSAVNKILIMITY